MKNVFTQWEWNLHLDVCAKVATGFSPKSCCVTNLVHQFLRESKEEENSLNFNSITQLVVRTGEINAKCYALWEFDVTSFQCHAKDAVFDGCIERVRFLHQEKAERALYCITWEHVLRGDFLLERRQNVLFRVKNSFSHTLHNRHYKQLDSLTTKPALHPSN